MYLSSAEYDIWQREANSSYSYSYYSSPYTSNFDACDAKTSFWKLEFALTLIVAILSLVSNVLYLAMVIFCGSLAHSYFLFLNSFMVANFVNLTIVGPLKTLFAVNHCWKSGDFMCKAVHGLVNYSENAIAFYMIVLILEQCHPRVRAFFLSDDRRRKLIVTIAILIGTIVFSIPEFISVEVKTFGKMTLCVISSGHSGNLVYFFLHKSVIIEYWFPLLILFVLLIHAAFQLRRRRNRPSVGTIQGDSSIAAGIAQQTGNDEDDGWEGRCPRYPWMTLALGLAFFITRLPYYVCLTITATGSPACYRVGKPQILVLVMHGLFNCLPPAIILFLSPFHREKARETLQHFLSCLSGRRVESGFALRDDAEQ